MIEASVLNLEEHWQSVDLGEEYDWEITDKSWKKLSDIIENLPRDLPREPQRILNTRLREFLFPHLRGAKRLEVCRWIATDWGRIQHRNKDRFSALVGSFGDFASQNVFAAATHLGFDRISTWSKLAAFAYRDDFAIFDSRTAGAVNRILFLSGYENKFFVPTAKGKKANQLRAQHSVPTGRSLSYRDYLNILKSAKRPLLEVEMTIFANSDRICALQSLS
jgi:hypothetical protein